MIESPIIIEFDPDGRLWAIEMPAFLPDLSGRDSPDPINRVVVLEDTDDDGRMDKRTVFADQLVQPRALKVLDRGVLIGEPPNLWLMKDTNGDLKADTKDLVSNTFGTAGRNIEHNANALFWAMDNIMYSSEHTWDLRMTPTGFETLPALSRGQWQISQDDAGRIYRNVNDSPLYVDYTPSRYFLRNPNVVRTRGLYELLIDQAEATVFPVRPTRGINRGYRDPGPLFRADGSSTVIQGAGTPTIYRGDRYPRDLWGNAFITDSPTNLVHRFILADDKTGKLTAQQWLHAWRVPRLVGRALPASEPVFCARRHDVRRGHVPRRRAGRRDLVGVPDRLHQEERAIDAGGLRAHLARRPRYRGRRSRPEARAVEGHAAGARGDVVASERLVARHGAAPAGRAS